MADKPVSIGGTLTIEMARLARQMPCKAILMTHHQGHCMMTHERGMNKEPVVRSRPLRWFVMYHDRHSSPLNPPQQAPHYDENTLIKHKRLESSCAVCPHPRHMVMSWGHVQCQFTDLGKQVRCS